MKVAARGHVIQREETADESAERSEKSKNEADAHEHFAQSHELRKQCDIRRHHIHQKIVVEARARL